MLDERQRAVHEIRAAVRLGNRVGEFLQFQFAHFVVEFHNRQRFHEQRCAAGGLIVNHSFDAAFEFSAQRNHISSITLGDDRFLQFLRRLGQVALQARHRCEHGGDVFDYFRG